MQHSEESARLVKARLEKTTLGQVAKSIGMRLHSTEVSCPQCPFSAVPCRGHQPVDPAASFQMYEHSNQGVMVCQPDCKSQECQGEA